MENRNIKLRLKKHSITNANISKMFNRHRVSVSAWLTGRIIPPYNVINDISKMTNGDVTFDDWVAVHNEFKKYKSDIKM